MAKIVDPDQLSQEKNATPSGTTEVTFDTTARLIHLSAVGNLNNEDGCTLQALYSFCKEEWSTDADLIKLPFPFEAITEVKFDVINGWDFADAATRNRLRDAGWSLRDNSGNSQEEYMGFVTLGSMDNPSADLAYFQQEVAGAPTDAVFTGPANEPVKIYGDGTHGSIDYRSVFKAFLREQGKTYSSSSLAEQGVANIDYTVYKLPLANAVDPKISESDANIGTNAPYTSMAIEYLDGTGFTTWAVATGYSIGDVVKSAGGRWFRATSSGTSAGDDTDLAGGSDTGVSWEVFAGERQIGATYYAFNVIVDGANATAEQIYEFTQYKNRQDSDINDHASEGGTVNGKTADQLLAFLGDTLQTGTGVYIDNFNANDTNRIEFFDVGAVKRTYPFVASGTINFNANLVNDASAKYWMFFDDPDGTPASGDEYGTTGAIIVEDNGASPISGNVSAQNSVSFTFDYDGNTQGGRSAGTDADVTVVAIGLDTAQFVKFSGTITRNTGITFSLVSSLERNYANPA